MNLNQNHEPFLRNQFLEIHKNNLTPNTSNPIPPMKSTIRIQELPHNEATNTFQVRLTFLYDGDEDSIDNIAFPNPHTEATEDLMERYFEKYISTPYDDVPYQSIVQKIEEYGEGLFNAFFSSNEAFRLYFNIIQNCAPENVVIEIVAQTPTFQGLYWEAMKAPNELPLAAQGMVIRRKNIRSNIIKAEVKPAPNINLLIVTARPNEDSDVAYRTIQRPLIELIKQAKLRVKAHILRPGTYEAFLKHLDEVGAKHYHIIHFDLHGSLMSHAHYEHYYKQAEKADFNRHLFKNPLFKGTYALTELPPYEHKKAFLFFESRKKGVAVPVEAEQLAAVLRQQQVPIIILNACQSAKQDQKDTSNETSLGRILIQQGIQLVLAMRYSVSVTAAKLLMQVLYKELYNQTGVEKAIAQARKELYRLKSRRAAYNRAIDLEDWLLPVVYQNRSPKLQLRTFKGGEKTAFVQSTQIPHSIQQHLPYGFFGRDLDILQIEKALLTQRNILLLQGMGGAGKTTLLKYLGKWWLQTGFVEQVFYFGYDEKAHTKTDILNSIARQIFDEVALAQWRVQSEAVKEYDILQAFNTNSYALILDNAESITGAKLAIQHTLNETQRHELHQFLQQLSGGKSKILIGSRSDETWLKAGTFGSNHLILSGLDRESAKNFADKIISELNIPMEYIAKDLHFTRLLKLLAGYPLALKAVLPNLRNKTSQQILEELDKGLDSLSTGSSQERTENILKCIEYAHSNLSEDAQKLLLCLAPFVGVVNLTPQLIQTYFDELSKNVHFRNYPFDRLSVVVQEAVRNGFMQEINTGLNVRMVQLQPVFTYFIKNKLQVNQQQLTVIFNDAYIIYCSHLGAIFDDMFASKNPRKHEISEILIRLEYENLIKALFLKLNKQESILTLINPIIEYLVKNQQNQNRLGILEEIYLKVKKYDKKKLNDKLIIEIVGLMDAIGKAYYDLKVYSKAKQMWKEGLFSLKNINSDDDINKGILYQNLGVLYQNEKNYKLAKDYYKKSLAIYKQHKDIARQANIHHNLGVVCKIENDYEGAKDYYRKALEIHIKYNNPYGQANLYQNLGNVFLDEKNYDLANDFYKKALGIYTQYKNHFECAGIFKNLGNVFHKKKDYVSAKFSYEKALLIYEQYKDVYSQAQVYQNLGNICNDLKDYVVAKGYCKKALVIYEQYKDIYSQVQVYQNLGTIYHKEKNYLSAKSSYEKVLLIAKQHQDVHLQARVYLSIGSVCSDVKNYVSAKNYYEKALIAYEKLKDFHNQARVYQNLGVVCSNEKNYSSSKSYYEKALLLFGQYGDIRGQAYVYQNLGNICCAEKKYSFSKSYYEKALMRLLQIQDIQAVLEVLGVIIRLPKEANTKPLAQSILGEIKKTFQNNPDILAVLEEAQQQINKIQPQ